MKENEEKAKGEINLMKSNEQVLVAKINKLDKRIVQLDENNRVLKNEVESLQI